MIRRIFRFMNVLFFGFFVLAIVSFGEVSSAQKEEAKNQCVSLFSWNEFSLMVSVHTSKKKKKYP